ncbi:MULTISPECIES: DUF4259 domain-containing protein [unclassified Sphingomonas]|uniref:DUF4259 domain-containing protein n=1 Tax=unclassified Sphingomonas TaxID=196159 RepID=UPI0006F31767|nr:MULTISPECIES: DUF4259 domain-containing protein [unclassified Sphingomonas]KQM96615.1 hypothetical protein ASE78_11550 [Sphingomonas sp. Leaf25]
MGAWGVQFDECDSTLDFLGVVADSRDWNDVRYRLRDYVDNGGYDEAEEAIAALELVAAALGRPAPRLKPELAAWAAGHGDTAAADRTLASSALDLVENASELNELWAETDEYAAWQATLADLRMRLRA